MGYRADIQFMRAVAVTLVVLYHLGAPIPAGFLGVDVFFVISGFLMQKLYKSEDGPLGFYLRRGKRLLPAYYITVTATLIAAFFITLPTEFRQVATQSIYASIFASNIGFWIQNSYFSKAEFNPLLHLWSLGVEMQFYFIFPLLWYLGRKYRLSVPIIMIISLVACLAAVEISPKTSFFMMPLRLWQFAAGMLVARYAPSEPRGGWMGLCALAAILAIAFAPIDGLAINFVMGHPGFGAVGATYLTAAVLWLGLPASLIQSTFGRVAERLGDISYSLYLTHFPVIILLGYQPFGGTKLGDGNLAMACVAVFIFMAAAAVLYGWVERYGPGMFRWKACAAASALIVMLSLSLPPSQARRLPKADQLIFAAWTDRGTYRCGKIARILSPSATTCDLSTGPKGQILLIGDSHADAIKSSLIAVASKHGYGVRFSVSNAPLMEPAYGSAWLKREAARPDVRFVILHYAAKNINDDLLTKAVDAVKDTTYMFLLPTPHYREHVPSAIYNSRHNHFFSLTRVSDRRVVTMIMSRMNTVADPTSAFCGDKRCDVVDADGALLYFDDGHLTLTGARRLEPIFERKISILNS